MARSKQNVWKPLICLLLCDVASSFLYPFLNSSLSWDERVDDLVNRLSLYEIVEQTSAAVSLPPPSVARLGIQPYYWDTECLRGYVHRNATAYPDSLGLAASFRYGNVAVYYVSVSSSGCTKLGETTRCHFEGNAW